LRSSSLTTWTYTLAYLLHIALHTNYVFDNGEACH